MSANDSASSPNSAAHGGCVMRFVGHLFLCRHDWSITGCNGFGHPSEEQCIKCGEYRHLIHDFDKFRRGVDEEWKTGKHPKSK
jgi:hypothetical protein